MHPNQSESPLLALEHLIMSQVAPLQGRFGEIGIKLDPSEQLELVQADSLLNPDNMVATIEHFSTLIGTDDPRIGGTHWLGQLGYALLPPIEMAMTRAGIGLDASLDNLMIVLVDEKPAQVLLRDVGNAVIYAPRVPDAEAAQIAAGAGITSTVATSGDLRQFVMERLIDRNLRPLVDLINDLTGVSSKVLWGQVAYEADLFYQQLVRVDPDHRTPAWEEDRAALFATSNWLNGVDQHPFLHPTRTIESVASDGTPKVSNVRSTCCLIYQSPNGRMCGACPLARKKDVVNDLLASVNDRRLARSAGSA